MAEIGGLSVSVSAATTQFRSSINAAQEATRDLSLSLRRLSSSANSAEEEVDSVGRSAATSSAGMTSFALSTEGASVATTSLSGTLVASLLPALVTVGAALTPLIAALGGFVAIVGSIAGIGIIGAIAAISENTKLLKTQFEGLVETLRDVFSPVIRAATGVLLVLIEELEETLQTIQFGSQINVIAGAFAELGTQIIELIPSLLDLAISLATEFLPPFIQFTDRVLPQVPGLIRSLVGEFRRLIPLFTGFGGALVALLPELLEFGRIALPIIAQGLAFANDALVSTLGFVTNLDSNIQSLLATASLLAPVLVGIASFLSGPIALAIGGVVAGVIALREAWQNNFLDIQGIVGSLRTEIQELIDPAQEAANAFLSGFDIQGIIDSINTLVGIFEDQLKTTVTELEPVFNDFKDLLENNREEFEIIGGAVSGVIRAFLGFAQSIVGIAGPALRGVFIPAMRGLVTILDSALTTLSNFIELFNAVKKGNFGTAQSIVGEIAGNQVDLGAELTEGIASQETTETIQQGAQVVEVTLSGEGELTDAIAEESDAQIKQVGDRAFRLGTRTP